MHFFSASQLGDDGIVSVQTAANTGGGCEQETRLPESPASWFLDQILSAQLKLSGILIKKKTFFFLPRKSIYKESILQKQSPICTDIDLNEGAHSGIVYNSKTYNPKDHPKGRGREVILGCLYSYESANKRIKGDLYVQSWGDVQDAHSGINNQIYT